MGMEKPGINKRRAYAYSGLLSMHKRMNKYNAAEKGKPAQPKLNENVNSAVKTK